MTGHLYLSALVFQDSKKIYVLLGFFTSVGVFVVGSSYDSSRQLNLSDKLKKQDCKFVYTDRFRHGVC